MFTGDISPPPAESTTIDARTARCPTAAAGGDISPSVATKPPASFLATAAARWRAWSGVTSTIKLPPVVLGVVAAAAADGGTAVTAGASWRLAGLQPNGRRDCRIDRLARFGLLPADASLSLLLSDGPQKALPSISRCGPLPDKHSLPALPAPRSTFSPPLAVDGYQFEMRVDAGRVFRRRREAEPCAPPPRGGEPPAKTPPRWR